MLEIIFNRKCTEKCDVKVIGLAEKQSFCDSAFVKFLDKEECRILHQAIKAENFTGKSGTWVDSYSAKGRLIAVGLGCRPQKPCAPSFEKPSGKILGRRRQGLSPEPGGNRT